MEYQASVSPPIEKVQKADPESHSNPPRSIASASALTPEILDQLQDAVLTTSLEGVITSCNLGLGRYGYAPEELVGKNLADLFCADDQSVLTKRGFAGVRENGRCE